MQSGQSDSSMHGLLILTFWNLSCHAVLFTMSGRGPSPTWHVWGDDREKLHALSLWPKTPPHTKLFCHNDPKYM